MGCLYRRPDSPYWWMKWRDADGKRRQDATRFRLGDPAQEAEARRTLALLERRVKAEQAEASGVLTVEKFAAKWLEGLRRRELESAGQYAQRLRDFIFPVIGSLPLREVRPHHVRELVRTLREEGRLAPRTTRNIYAVARGLFREAAGRELVDASPCVLLRHELPPKEDRDPAWRASAVFSRREVELVISDERRPPERRSLAAALFLAGPRIGEALELRWRDYDTAVEPLGRLTVARSWSTKHHVVRSTKTRNVRQVPVHPVLAQVLAEWRLSGWAAFMGRAPREDDLLFPNAVGEHRNANSAKAAFYRDLEALGLRPRRQHDARRTFISLVQADGGRRELLRYVTHGPEQTVMDLYTTPPWPELCETVAKLKIGRLGAREVAALPWAANGGNDGGKGCGEQGPRQESGQPSVGIPCQRGRLPRLPDGDPPPRERGHSVRLPEARLRGGTAPTNGTASLSGATPPSAGAADSRPGCLGERGRGQSSLDQDEILRCHATEGEVPTGPEPAGGPSAASPARTGPAEAPGGAVRRSPTRMGSAGDTAQSRPGPAREPNEGGSDASGREATGGDRSARSGSHAGSLDRRRAGPGGQLLRPGDPIRGNDGGLDYRHDPQGSHAAGREGHDLHRIRASGRPGPGGGSPRDTGAADRGDRRAGPNQRTGPGGTRRQPPGPLGPTDPSGHGELSVWLRSATLAKTDQESWTVEDGRGGTRKLIAGGPGALSSPSYAGLAPNGLEDGPQEPTERSREATLALPHLHGRTVTGPNGCLLWTGSLDRAGYGRVLIDGRYRPAHRVIYELSRGPIPEGLVLDHLCRTPRCVNPEHLEPVTIAENLKRGRPSQYQLNAMKTHCLRGHPLEGENLCNRRDGKRQCRTCKLADLKERRQRRSSSGQPDSPCGPRGPHGTPPGRDAGHVAGKFPGNSTEGFSWAPDIQAEQRLQPQTPDGAEPDPGGHLERARRAGLELVR